MGGIPHEAQPLSAVRVLALLIFLSFAMPCFTFGASGCGPLAKQTNPHEHLDVDDVAFPFTRPDPP